jgi:amphi-Trp domain-containing protein
MPKEKPIDVEKSYKNSAVVEKLRRLADALEAGKTFEIKIAGNRVYVPPTAEIEFEYESNGDAREIEIEIKWTKSG